MTDRQALRVHLAALVLVWLAVTTAASLCATPVGPVEEHFALGRQLRATGSLGGAVLRPPGFPVFVALVLWTRDTAGLGHRLDDASAVIAAQRFGLLLSSVVLFRLWARNGSPRSAFLIGALMSANPLSVVLSGALTYPMLDLVLILLGTVALVVATAAAAPRPGPALVAGLVWGLAALVRPVGLAMPAFVAALAWLSGRWTWRASWRLPVWFSLGMVVVVAPYVLRNYTVSGRFVPVSAQAGFALWASSAARPGPDDPYVSWGSAWQTEGLPIYARVTGQKEYALPVFTLRALDLNDAFRGAAIENIRRDPATYATNVADNLWRFPFDTSAWWWRRFSWENAGRPLAGTKPAAATPRARRAASLASAFLLAQSLVGLAGLLMGLRRRDPWAGPVLAVLAALWIGNSATLLLSRYTYAKLPLLIVSTGMLFRAPSSRVAAFLARWIVPALVVLALASTLTMLMAGA